MSEKLADTYRKLGDNASPISLETCESLIEQAKNGSVSLPRLVNMATLGGDLAGDLGDKLEGNPEGNSGGERYV